MRLYGACVRADGSQALKHLKNWQFRPGSQPGRREAAMDGTAACSVKRNIGRTACRTALTVLLSHPKTPHWTNFQSGPRDRSRLGSGRGGGTRCRGKLRPAGSRRHLRRQLNGDGVAHAEVPTSTLRSSIRFRGLKILRGTGSEQILAAQTALAPQTFPSSQ